MRRFHEKPNRFVTQVTLRVQDIERSKEFYKHIMGFKILEEKEEVVVLTVDGLTPMLTLIQPKSAIAKIPRRTGLYHFALLLPNRIQLGLFLKNMRDNNYPIGGSNHGVSEAIYLQDPDNNGIEVYADIENNLWQWKEKEIEMITEPLDYESLLAETYDKKWLGMTKETIIGHIHLHVSDLNEAKRFYVEGMGFDVVMEIPGSALFLSSGGYHHHIGLNIWNGKGVAPLPENAAGMENYIIIFPNYEVMKDTISNLKELGYVVVEENDQILTKDPADNLIIFTL